MSTLTPRQHQVYRFIQTCLDHSGVPPTLQEIAAHLGINGNMGVLRHLQALEKKGYIERTRGGSRGIRVVGRRSARGLPVLGTVAAGPLREALQDADDWIQVDASLARSDDCFGLRVEGDSMIEAHILSGDVAVVRPQQSANDGDIVVAMVGGEATLKRFFHQGDSIRLQPENARMEAIVISDADEGVRILGKVTGIIRSFGR